VHQKTDQPLTVFTTLAFGPGLPEVEREKPFARLIAPYGEYKAGNPETQIDSRFTVDEKDLVIPKTRWCATTGNALEQILRAQNIDTVVIVSFYLCAVPLQC
jgi:nicotinamidase-related amidase